MSISAIFTREAARYRLRLLGRAGVQAVLAYLGIGLAIAMVVAGGMLWFILLIPVFLIVIAIIRRFADFHRRRAGDLLGVEIPSPYRPKPAGGALARLDSVVRDPATWRDLLWLVVNAVAGVALNGLAVALALNIVLLAFLPAGYAIAPDVVTGSSGEPANWVFVIVTDQASSFLAAAQIVPLFALTWWLLPYLMRAHARLIRWFLSPSGATKLFARVEKLAESRAEAVDAQAAELKRIERDLHDGAQARLVSLGMNLGMTEELLDKDPEEARKLLAEAQQSTKLALSELRHLVRGIHPPILSDRGLDGAVRALALSQPGEVDVAVTLPSRPDPPVESAAYFAIAEALTNVAKHASATNAWVEVWYDDGTLRLCVGDDGLGGAVIEPGGGLHGVERRLAAFDGTLSLTSPTGGPTIVIMELPCVLSSPKTSPSSGTA